MHCEVPDCRRCLFCVPLRYGILIFGYLNLLFNLLLISVEAYVDIPAYSFDDQSMALYRGLNIMTQIWFTFILYLLEAIFNIILLIGAHTKQPRLIRIYYYYGIMTTVAACLSFFVTRYANGYRDISLYYLEPFLAFSGFVINLYLLLLIRTELQKLKYQQGQFSYVNQMSEVILEPPVFGNGRNPL